MISSRFHGVGVEVPSQLGRYEIVKHLASGGMAELLLARSRGLEGFVRHFVIKRIRTDQERDAAFVEMFLTEARLAAALHHHHIVQVHDIGEDDGKPYFAMEYVHGEDLRRVLARLFARNQQMPVEHVITIVCAVAAALHHAHDATAPDRTPLGIVHRDVTPANILIGYDGNVKVVDFGIARAALRRTETQAGMLAGKAPYMSPEHCNGAAIDRRSDVFALGIVAFELVTGRRLFKGENEFLTMSAVVEAKVPKPSTHREGVPPELDAIILKAMAREPGARYQTAEHLYLALEELGVKAGLRGSGLALAAYMKELFGHRPEPWLGDDDRPVVTSPDFDGALPGLARPPTESVESFTIPGAGKPKTSSPISRARTSALSDSPTAVTPPLEIPEPIGEQKSVKIPTAVVARATSGSKTPVPPPPTKRGRPKTMQIPTTKSAAPEEAVTPTDKPIANGSGVIPLPEVERAPKLPEGMRGKPTPRPLPGLQSKAAPSTTSVETTPTPRARPPVIPAVAEGPPERPTPMPVPPAPVAEPRSATLRAQLESKPTPAIWTNPNLFAADEPSVVVRAESTLIDIAPPPPEPAPPSSPHQRASTDIDKQMSLDESTAIDESTTMSPPPPEARRRPDTEIVPALPAPWINAAPTVDDPLPTRRKPWIVPGAIGAGLLVVILALAIGFGGDDIADKPARAATVSEPATPTETAGSEPAKTKPAIAPPAPPTKKATDKTTARTKPPKRGAAKTEPAPAKTSTVAKTTTKAEPPPKKAQTVAKTTPPATKPSKIATTKTAKPTATAPATRSSKHPGWDPNRLFPKKKK